MTVETFFTETSTRYHQGESCQAFEHGRERWDYDSPDGYEPIRWPLPILKGSEQDALARGKKACAVCIGERPLRPSAEDFGHRPSAGFMEGRAIGTICERCEITHRSSTFQVEGETYTMTGRSSVRWPCASAVVLGLAQREEDA